MPAMQDGRVGKAGYLRDDGADPATGVVPQVQVCYGVGDVPGRIQARDELMYFIIRDSKKMKDDMGNPGIRKAALDAYDQAESMSLKDAAMLRRKLFPKLRLARAAVEYGSRGGEQVAAEKKAAMRAIRRSMERRINE